jgi:hypothetical protein
MSLDDVRTALTADGFTFDEPVTDIDDAVADLLLAGLADREFPTEEAREAAEDAAMARATRLAALLIA